MPEYIRDFATYQRQAATTALTTSERGGLPDLAYYCIGICDESGEVAGKIKKIFRDNNGLITPGVAIALALELGDVLWYLAMIAQELGYPLAEVANMNIEKLAARKAAGLIHGNGDYRQKRDSA